MKIDRLILGQYETNCYILRKSELARDCLIIDTGLESEQLIEFLKTNNLIPAAVVLTHGHADHIAGVAALRGQFPGIKVYIHELDARLLTEPQSNLSLFAGRPFRTEPADFTLQAGSIIEQAGIKIQVLHTPGHTPGGICLYAKDEDLVFTDDTLFAESVGRTDFPGSEPARLIKSIKDKLLTLPDETMVYPGHGPTTTIAKQKECNPFLQF